MRCPSTDPSTGWPPSGRRRQAVAAGRRSKAWHAEREKHRRGDRDRRRPGGRGVTIGALGGERPPGLDARARSADVRPVRPTSTGRTRVPRASCSWSSRPGRSRVMRARPHVEARRSSTSPDGSARRAASGDCCRSPSRPTTSTPGASTSTTRTTTATTRSTSSSDPARHPALRERRPREDASCSLRHPGEAATTMAVSSSSGRTAISTISTGDGGGSGDANDNARHLSSLLGKILRIDPRKRGHHRYTVPARQPVRRAPGARPRSTPTGSETRGDSRSTPRDRTHRDRGRGPGIARRRSTTPRCADARGANFGWPQLRGRPGLRLQPARPEPGPPAADLPDLHLHALCRTARSSAATWSTTPA